MRLNLLCLRTGLFQGTPSHLILNNGSFNFCGMQVTVINDESHIKAFGDRIQERGRWAPWNAPPGPREVLAYKILFYFTNNNNNNKN